MSYRIFNIPKRGGGHRTIEAPDPALKSVQRGLLKKLYVISKPSPFAYGFVKRRNIAGNARLHEGRKYLVKLDVKDFFPSISYSRMLREVQNADPQLTTFITENASVLFHDFNDGKGLRLPQGAPTSPCLSNIFMWKLDWRLAWACKTEGVVYSRYADDLIMSGDDPQALRCMMARACRTLEQLGLTINTRKISMHGAGSRQLVTGLVVNKRAALPRKVRKNLRAALYQARMAGKKPDPRTAGMAALDLMVRKEGVAPNNVEIGTIIEVRQQL